MTRCSKSSLQRAIARAASNTLGSDPGIAQVIPPAQGSGEVLVQAVPAVDPRRSPGARLRADEPC